MLVMVVSRLVCCPVVAELVWSRCMGGVVWCRASGLHISIASDVVAAVIVAVSVSKATR